MWNSKVRIDKLTGEYKQDLRVINISGKRIVTMYPTTLDKIRENFNPTKFYKVMTVPKKVVKEEKMWTTESIVKQYEDILDYLSVQDDAHGFEVVSRLQIEEEWEDLPANYKQRILEVDKIVLEKYADLFSYPLWQEYIAKIGARING